MVRRTLFCASVVLLLLVAGRAAAQTAYPYAPLDPQAVARAVALTEDSTDIGDLILTQISTPQLDLLDGRSMIWTYQFFSPSEDELVIVGIVNIDGVFTPYYWYSIPRSGTIYPILSALDTTGDFVTSTALTGRLMSSPEFQQFRMDHPTEGPPTATLSSVDVLYPPPAGFPSNEAFWSVYSGRYGDSIFVCQYATESDTLICGWRFYMEAESQFLVTNAGDVEFTVTNLGSFGGDFANNAAGFTVPAGSGRDYIYGAGFWVGARVDSQGQRVGRAVMSYNPNSGASDFRPGDGYLPRTSYSHPNVFLSTQYNGQTGEPVDADGEFRWPLWLRPGAAPSTFMEPGTYVLRSDDRVAGGAYSSPAMVDAVSAQFVSRYHDVYAAMSGGGAEAIGLQFQENVFANPEGFDFTVFVSYMMINQSGDTLLDVVVAPVADFDIGTATNDRTRFYTERPELRTAVAWTGTEAGQAFGTLAITLLEAPMVDGAGFVDNSLRSTYRGVGRAAGYQSWTIETDPTSPGERYDFMTENSFDGDLSAGDRRGLLSSTPFHMAPGDTAYFAVSYTVLPNVRSAQAANPSVDYRVENLINAYYGIEAAGVDREENGATIKLSVAPNPARDQLAVIVGGAGRGPATVEVFTAAGERALTRALTLDGPLNRASLDVSSLSNGVYTVVVTSAGARSAQSVVIVR